jgi:hypothetical protein
MCMDIQFNEKKKMGDRSAEEDVQIIKTYINKGKF